MVKVTVLYDQPEDPAAFEKYYNETHVPKHGQQIPNVVKLEANKAVGEQPPFYRSADLYFESMASLEAGLGSPIGVAAIAELDSLGTERDDGVSMQTQPVKTR